MDIINWFFFGWEEIYVFEGWRLRYIVGRIVILDFKLIIYEGEEILLNILIFKEYMFL